MTKIFQPNNHRNGLHCCQRSLKNRKQSKKEKNLRLMHIRKDVIKPVIPLHIRSTHTHSLSVSSKFCCSRHILQVRAVNVLPKRLLHLKDFEHVIVLQLLFNFYVKCCWCLAFYSRPLFFGRQVVVATIKCCLSCASIRTENIEGFSCHLS